jgi:hypothetical protein
MTNDKLKFKFKYRPKQFKSHLYGGIVSVVMGLVYLIFFELSVGFFFLLYGILMLVNYYYSKNFSYIIIENKGIKVNRFIPKKIRWEDYTGMKFYVGDIRVLSKNKSIDINKELLNDVDIEIIEEELKARLPSRQ